MGTEMKKRMTELTTKDFHEEIQFRQKILDEDFDRRILAGICWEIWAWKSAKKNKIIWKFLHFRPIKMPI